LDKFTFSGPAFDIQALKSYWFQNSLFSGTYCLFSFGRSPSYLGVGLFRAPLRYSAPQRVTTPFPNAGHPDEKMLHKLPNIPYIRRRGLFEKDSDQRFAVAQTFCQGSAITSGMEKMSNAMTAGGDAG
jgi:hypothetical protein